MTRQAGLSWALLLAVILTLYFATFARAVDVEGNLNVNDVLKELEDLDRGTVVRLNSGQHVGYLKADGSFLIPDVPPGLYILEVSSLLYTYDRLWIDIEPNDEPRAAVYIPGTEYEYNPMYSVPYPLELGARAKTSYFTPREGFNFMSILQNPMMLMMGFMVLGVYVMPKMMEGIDPEELKEAQKKMAADTSKSAIGKILNAAKK